MAKLINLKNNTIADKTWVGVVIPAGEYRSLSETEAAIWKTDDKVFSDVSDGTLIVNNGTADLDPGLTAWDYFSGEDVLPRSDLDGQKVAVHSSPKPHVPGSTTYVVWTGAGDDIAGNLLGEGPLLHFTSEVGTPVKTIDVKFLPAAGRVWIHEGYLKFTGGGAEDFVSSNIRAEATALQTSVNLDLVVESNFVKYAPGGAGTGTHGWAGTPILLPRSFSNDGDWDWDGANLTPNLDGTGNVKISDIEQIVHRYVNRIPCYGNTNNYFTMSSDETTELPSGYYVQILQHNNSDTVWHASVIIEIYRERTTNP